MSGHHLNITAGPITRSSGPGDATLATSQSGELIGVNLAGPASVRNHSDEASSSDSSGPTTPAHAVHSAQRLGALEQRGFTVLASEPGYTASDHLAITQRHSAADRTSLGASPPLESSSPPAGTRPRPPQARQPEYASARRKSLGTASPNLTSQNLRTYGHASSSTKKTPTTSDPK